MSRETFVMRDGLAVLKDEAAPLHASAFILRDQMDATWHPANGGYYDSKSAFRKATRAAGCIEVGDAKVTPRVGGPPKLDNRQRANDIKRSIYQLRNGSR